MLALSTKTNLTRVTTMTITEIRQKAKEVISLNYLQQPPIDIYSLAKNYGLHIFKEAFPSAYLNVSGFITITNGVPQLFVNSNDSVKRRNFTVAHELGHWLLHKDKIIEDPNLAILFRIPLGTLNTDPLEKEANAFAAELLVPKSMLDSFRNNKTPRQLSELFNVSEEVIGYRLEHTRENSESSRLTS
jgi:Zn-dependent peptidase ImmA (M78 family)